MKLIRWAVVALSVSIAAISGNAQKSGPWDQPAAALADQIAGILGPGQARFTLRNLSTISSESVSAIQALLERDLKAHGILLAGDEGANVVRVTLSENTRERLWIAEVAEGAITQVAMVETGPIAEQHAVSTTGLTLRAQTVLTSRQPVLAALETPGGWIVLEPEQLVLYLRAADGFHAQSRADIGLKRTLPRDPRGIFRADVSPTQFNAWLAGVECKGPTSPGQPPAEWTVACHSSDDPWPLTPATSLASAEIMENIRVNPVTGFYNASRNYFTGVLAPSTIADMPPFYSFAEVPRSVGAVAWLIGSIDGRVLLFENGSLKPIAGARDWGSDFAVLHSGCGSGAQIVASSSGEAAPDSLRAYELPALEAIPSSAPLEAGGIVTALWSAPDGRSILAVVQRATDQYEVDRVSALCN
jgi:hypothetical protein